MSGRIRSFASRLNDYGRWKAVKAEPWWSPNENIESGILFARRAVERAGHHPSHSMLFTMSIFKVDGGGEPSSFRPATWVNRPRVPPEVAAMARSSGYFSGTGAGIPAIHVSMKVGGTLGTTKLIEVNRIPRYLRGEGER